MKLHSILTDLLFFLLILTFSIWSIFISFTNSSQIFIQWNFPFSQLLLALFALFILIYYWKKDEKSSISSLVFLLQKLFPFILSLSILFCTALLFKGFTCFIHNEKLSGSTSAVLPSSFKEIVYCVLSFAFAAFYEEVIYRFYLPEICRNFVFKKISSKKILFIMSEFLALTIFSLAHVYLGWLAVLNAVIAHIVLRFCLLKSESLWPGFAAHFIYNLLVLFLL